MTFYTEIAADAKALLAEFGQDVTLVTTTHGSYDVDTGTTTDSTVTQSGLKAAITNYKISEKDSTKIQESTNVIIIESVADPSVNSVVTNAASEVFTVIDFIKIAPSGEAVIYKMWVKK